MGEAWHPSKCAAGPTDCLHLYLRRGLPPAGKGCSPDPAGLQYRGNEPAPSGNRQDHRAWCPCVLMVDQAGWHLSTPRVVPPTLTIIALPPKCPELNPVENVWQTVCSLSARVARPRYATSEGCVGMAGAGPHARGRAMQKKQQVFFGL